MEVYPPERVVFFWLMNPTNESGNFGSVLGNGTALGRALSQRQGGGEGVSPLSQVSPSIDTGQEGAQPTPPTGNPSMSVPQGAAPQATMPSGAPVGGSETELIIKALSSRLSSLSKLEQGPVAPTM